MQSQSISVIAGSTRGRSGGQAIVVAKNLLSHLPILFAYALDDADSPASGLTRRIQWNELVRDGSCSEDNIIIVCFVQPNAHLDLKDVGTRQVRITFHHLGAGQFRFPQSSQLIVLWL